MNNCTINDFQLAVTTTTTTVAPSAPCNFPTVSNNKCAQYVQMISDCLAEITIPVDPAGPHIIGVAGASQKKFPLDTQVRNGRVEAQTLLYVVYDNKTKGQLITQVD